MIHLFHSWSIWIEEEHLEIWRWPDGVVHMKTVPMQMRQCSKCEKRKLVKVK